MTDKPELLPCPYCGSPAEIEEGSDHHGAWFNLGCSRHWGHERNPDHTNTCIAQRMFYTETEVPLADAIAAWNTRATPSQPDASALVEALERIKNARTAMDGGSIAECRRIAEKALSAWEQANG